MSIWLTPTRTPRVGRRRGVPLIWRIGLALCLLSGLAIGRGGDDTAALQAVSERAPILAYYYIWFDPGSWDRAKIDYPLLGRYSSDDRQVMEQHVRWAQDAGITGFIVSWKHTEVLTRRLELLVEVAAAADFKLAIVIQGLDVRRQPRPVDAIGADLDFFVAEFGSNPVFDLFGRPLVIWSGTWEFSRDEIAAVTGPLRAELFILATERNAGAYQSVADLFDGDAYYWSSVNPETYPDYAAKLAEMAEVVRVNDGLWIAPAAPGFDARLVGGTRVVERLDGLTLNRQLEAALASAPDAVGLISWNEFSENTHVEPSCTYGVQTLSALAEELGGQAPPAPAETGACGTPTPSPSSTPREVASVGSSAPPTAPAADLGMAAASAVETEPDRSDFDSSSPGGTIIRPWNLLIIGGLAAATVLSFAVIAARGRKGRAPPGGDTSLASIDTGLGAV